MVKVGRILGEVELIFDMGGMLKTGTKASTSGRLQTHTTNARASGRVSVAPAAEGRHRQSSTE